MKTTIALLSALFLSACASGPCVHMRQPQLAERAGATPVAATVAPGPTATGSTSELKSANSETGVSVFVAKADGSLQCGARGLSTEEMEKQLKGIKVISRDKRSDGKMHIQVCGSPTGMLNVYEIPDSSLKEAELRGFKKQ